MFTILVQVPIKSQLERGFSGSDLSSSKGIWGCSEESRICSHGSHIISIDLATLSVCFVTSVADNLVYCCTGSDLDGPPSS